MTENGILVVYDDNYMFPKNGENEHDFNDRLEKQRKQRNLQMTDEEKQQLNELRSKMSFFREEEKTPA